MSALQNPRNATEFAGILVHGTSPGPADQLLFQVPVTSHGWIHLISICNTTNGSSKFSMAFCARGVIAHPDDWIYNDVAIGSKTTVFQVFDVRLDPEDSIVVHSDTGGIAVTIFGSLI